MSTQARTKALAAGALCPGPAIFAGFSVRETAGAVATVRLWDNPAAGNGNLLATIALAANASSHFAVPQGVWVTGIFAEIVAGTVEGSVYLG